jgi:hypothetical protein
VIILDLRLGDHRSNDRTGLTLLEKLRDAPCILYSNYLTNDVTREAQARHDQVQWSGKAEEPEILVKQVNDATRNSSATRYGLRVAPGAHCSPAEVLLALFPGRTDLPPGLVADLLHQLFPQPKTIELELLTEEQQTSVPASRGHSLVCKVMPEGLAPFVVKFGPRDQVEREADRHGRHVHDRLDDRFYGDMSGHALFWDVGAAAYRFIGSTGGGLPTFSEFYGSHSDVEALLNPLRHFFAAVWGKHYRENSSSPDSLYTQYDRSFRLGSDSESPRWA